MRELALRGGLLQLEEQRALPVVAEHDAPHAELALAQRVHRRFELARRVLRRRLRLHQLALHLADDRAVVVARRQLEQLVAQRA